MPPKRTIIEVAPAGVAYQRSRDELWWIYNEVEWWGHKNWKRTTVDVVLIHGCTAALWEVCQIMDRHHALPEAVRVREIQWPAQYVQSERPMPRHTWRDNTVSLWWSIIAELTDEWEAAQERIGGGGLVGEILDDFTTAVDLLSRVKFPDKFGKMH